MGDVIGFKNRFTDKNFPVEDCVKTIIDAAGIFERILESIDAPQSLTPEALRKSLNDALDQVTFRPGDDAETIRLLVKTSIDEVVEEISNASENSRSKPIDDSSIAEFHENCLLAQLEVPTDHPLFNEFSNWSFTVGDDNSLPNINSLEALGIFGVCEYLSKLFEKEGLGLVPPYPGLVQHSARVACYTLILAKELKLDNPYLAAITGALHDIAKMLPPFSRLAQKKGRFTTLERAGMKTHGPVSSELFELLKTFEEFNINGNDQELVKEAIAQHHVVSSNDEPCSKLQDILKITDAFDAMTSNRPHDNQRNPNESLQYATEQLKEGAGSQFKPDMVKLFLSLKIKPTIIPPRQYQQASANNCLSNVG